MKEQDELPGMPGPGPLDADIHRFEFVGEFKKNPNGVKGEMAVSQFLFECPLNGVSDDASRAIKNLLGKTVTIKVCSTEYNRYLNQMGRELAAKGKRAEQTVKRDAEPAKGPIDVAAAGHAMDVLPIGDYLDANGNRYAVDYYRADLGEGNIQEGYSIEVKPIDDQQDLASIAMDANVYGTEGEALEALKVWAGEKHGYKPVPPEGCGTAYLTKAKGAGIIRIWPTVDMRGYWGVMFTKDGDGDEVQTFIDGLEAKPLLEAQADLDAWATNRPKGPLEVAGYVKLSDIEPKSEVEPEPEATAEIDEPLHFEDGEDPPHVYSVGKSPTDQCLAILVQQKEQPDSYLTLTGDDDKSEDAAYAALKAMAEVHGWHPITPDNVPSDVADVESESAPEAIVEETAADSQAEDSGESEAEETAEEPAEEISEANDGHPVPSCIHAGIGVGCKKRNGQECLGADCQDQSDGSEQEQPAETSEPQANEPVASEELDCNRDCEGCEKEGCEARTADYDPFRAVPEHPESPNAEVTEEEPTSEPATDGEMTTIQRVQQAFANGAGAGHVLIDMKPDYRLPGARKEPYNVMKVADDGSNLTIMGKGDITAENVNEKYFFVE